MPDTRRHTLSSQSKTTKEESTMASAVCAAEAKGLVDTLQLLSSKRQEKITKLLAQGQRTLSNLNETNRLNFNDSYKEYRNLCAKIEE